MIPLKLHLLVVALVLFLSVCLCNSQSSPGNSSQQTTDDKLDIALHEGLEPFYDMTHIFIDAVRSNNLSDDIVTEIGLEKFDSYNKLTKDSFDAQYWVTQFKGYLACLIIGLLFIVTFLFGGLIFCCCRCCGNCGAAKNQYSENSPKCVRTICSIILFLFNTFMFTWVVLAFLTNQMLHKQTTLDDDGAIPQIINGLDTLQTYQHDTINDIEQALITSLNVGLDQLIYSLNALPQRAEENITILGNSEKLLQKTEKLSTITTEIDQNLNSIVQLQPKIIDQEDEVKSDGDAFKTAFSAACSAPSCPAALQAKVDALPLPNNEFETNLPNVTAESNAISAVLADNFGNNVKDSIKEFDKVNEIISNETAAQIKAVEDEKKAITKESDDIFNGIRNDTVNEINLNSTKSELTDNKSDLEEYDLYRYWVAFGMCIILLLIVLMNYLGILFGLCGDDVDEGSCNRGVGAKFLMAGVYCSLIFGWLLMIVTMILFMIGGLFYGEVCTLLVDLGDKPYSEIDTLLHPMLGDLPINISLASTFSQCKDNTAAYTALDLQQYYDLNNLNLSNYNLEAELDKFKTLNFDFTGITFASKDLSDNLDALSTSGVGNINFTAFDTVLGSTSGLSIVKLTDLRTQIVAISPSPGLAELDELITSFTKLQSLVTQMQGNVSDLRQAVDDSKGTSNFQKAVEDIKVELEALNANVTAQASLFVGGFISGFVTATIGSLQTTMDSLIYSVQFEVGRCKPLYLATSHIIDTVCYSVLDPFNGFWAAIGWCLLIMIPNIIIAVNLDSLYRKTEYMGHDGKSFDDPIFDHYRGHGDNIPLEDHPHIIRAGKRMPYQDTSHQHQSYQTPSSQGPPSYGGGAYQQSYPQGGNYQSPPGHYSNYR